MLIDIHHNTFFSAKVESCVFFSRGRIQIVAGEGRDDMMYAVAHRVWDITKWIWLVFIIPTSVDLFKSAVTAKKPEDIIPNSFLFGPDYRVYTFSTLGILLAITLTARIIIAVEQHRKGGKAFKEYLHQIVASYETLNPTGFDQQSPRLLSVSVPLNAVFIHLRAVADRPLYDISDDQQKLIEEIRQRPDLGQEERERLIQRLRARWYSQLGSETL